MADDRSLKDVLQFLDPSGSMTDADIAGVSKDLKFTEILDIITYVGKDDLDSAREILAKYDDRFATAASTEQESTERPQEQITQEYSSVPTSAKPSGFKPIKPVPTIAGKPTNPNPSTSQTQQPGQEDEEDLNTLLTDPATKNKPEVKQIQSLLQRMQRR